MYRHGTARDHRRGPHLDNARQPGFTSRRSAFKGKPASWSPTDYVYSYKRWLDPNLRRGGESSSRTWSSVRAPSSTPPQAGGEFDYDSPHRRLARPRSLHGADQARGPGYPTIRDVARQSARRHARWSKLPDATCDPGGRYGTLSASGMEAGLAYRPRSQSRLPQDSFPGDDQSRARRARAKKWQARPSPGSARSTSHHHRGPAAGAGVRARQARLHTSLQPDRESSARRQQLRAGLRARGVQRMAFAEPYVFSFYFNTDRSGGRGNGTDRIALRRAVAAGHRRE